MVSVRKTLQNTLHFFSFFNTYRSSFAILHNISFIVVKSGQEKDEKYLSGKELKTGRSTNLNITQEDIKKMPEMNPPDMMPQGNVGTASSYFLKQIQLCKLPPSIIRKLGIVFPKTRAKKQYSEVNFDYDTPAGEYSAKLIRIGLLVSHYWYYCHLTANSKMADHRHTTFIAQRGEAPS